MMPDNEKSIASTGNSQFPETKSGEWEIMTCVGQLWGPDGPSWDYRTSDQPPQLRIRTLENVPFEELPENCQKAIREGYGVGIDELDNFVIYRKTP